MQRSVFFQLYTLTLNHKAIASRTIWSCTILATNHLGFTVNTRTSAVIISHAEESSIRNYTTLITTAQFGLTQFTVEIGSVRILIPSQMKHVSLEIQVVIFNFIISNSDIQDSLDHTLPPLRQFESTELNFSVPLFLKDEDFNIFPNFSLQYISKIQSEMKETLKDYQMIHYSFLTGNLNRSFEIFDVFSQIIHLASLPFILIVAYRTQMEKKLTTTMNIHLILSSTTHSVVRELDECYCSGEDIIHFCKILLILREYFPLVLVTVMTIEAGSAKVRNRVIFRM